MLALADLMVVLDATVVYVALPSIQQTLRFSSTATLQWVVNAYVLAFAGFLLLGGKVADRFGRRRVFASAAIGFVATSLVCGVATSAGQLIAARAFQGLAAAFMAPAALSLVTTIFTEGDERNRALGVWGAIASAGAAIGLVAGGALVNWLSWRWAFLVNVPIGAFAAVASLLLIHETRDPVARGFDIFGAVSGTAGLAALIFALVNANQWGWGSPATIAVFLVAAALLGVFVVLQVRGRDPLVPPRLFRSRTLVAADVSMLLVGSGLFAVFFFLTLYMQQVLHYTPIETGLGFLAVTGTSITSATIGSRILARVGARRILVTGFLLSATGLILLVRISPTGSYDDILPSLLLIGSGNGGAFVSMTSLAVAGVSRQEAGEASALLNTSQQVGGALGLALLTAVAAARLSALQPSNPTPATVAAAVTSSWVAAFVVGAALVLCAAITSALLVRPRRNGVRSTPDWVALPPPCHGTVLPAPLGDAR